MTNQCDAANTSPIFPRIPLAAYFGMSLRELIGSMIAGLLIAIMVAGGDFSLRVLLDTAISFAAISFVWPRMREYRKDLSDWLRAYQGPEKIDLQRRPWVAKVWFAAILLFLALVVSIPAAGLWLDHAMAKVGKVTEQHGEVSRLLLLACATRGPAGTAPPELRQRCREFTADHVTDAVLTDGFTHLDRLRSEHEELMSSFPLSLLAAIAED